MMHIYQGIKTIIKVLGLLLFSIATSFCSYAQEENLDDIDGLIDELFFTDQQFVDELIESDNYYNFLYTTVSYNSNTFFSGRSSIDQFNIIPQISYYHSSGFNASISGIYYENFSPTWDFTSLSLGYYNTLGKKKNIVYNLGYTKYFYNDEFDDFTNSIDLSIGIRNVKRIFGSTISGSYLFGTDNSFQIISNSFVNFTLKKTPDFALRLRPNINFIISNQTISFIGITEPQLMVEEQVFTQNVFDLLNTQISLPLSITSNSWDFELGYNFNLPNAVASEADLSTTSFFNLSVGYMFDLKK
ncbi:hypothetical protein [uncultured Polaribacter sp.]|uniref:hypothetical protein n=1 Tax=uncultured Polaribacter sp. TaxID=174711 RepID=UPI00260400EA|nr:hypothetical protein [uncultured Polaribacter sp.]